jgi:hypothetical protein
VKPERIMRTRRRSVSGDASRPRKRAPEDVARHPATCHGTGRLERESVILEFRDERLEILARDEHPSLEHGRGSASRSRITAAKALRLSIVVCRSA